MRILIVTDSYPPELRSAAQLMADLAEGLYERGHSVTVATTVPAYNLASETNAESVPGEETVKGVNVFRIATLPHHRVNYIFRGISQILLPSIFGRSVKKKIKSPFDIVFVHSPPLPLALAASNLARHYHARLVANIQDIFPQNGMDLVSFWQKPLIWIFFKPMEWLVYRNADLIVVPSGSHARYLEEKRGVPSDKLRVVPHWIDVKQFDAAKRTGKFRKEWGLEGKFVFVFGGVLGPSQSLEILLRIAEKLREYEDIVFLFVGDGGAKARLEKMASDKKLTNVIFKSWVKSEEFPNLLKDFDVGFLSLTSKNTTPAVPAKLMSYMAAGIPVLAFLHKESDGLKIVEDAQCGLAAVSDDEEKAFELTKKIYTEKEKLSSYGENGQKHVLKHFTKEICISTLERIFLNQDTNQ